MTINIKGLHHVTSMAADAQTNNDFFTRTLGLRVEQPDAQRSAAGDRNGPAARGG